MFSTLKLPITGGIPYMKLKLLICDDSDLQLKETTSFAHSCLDASESFTFRIDSYGPEKLKKLLETDTINYDIAILDIEMGDFNGIDFASELNQCCPQCAVIFLTSHTDYISESYEVRHIYYVTKDSIQEYLPKALDKAIQLVIERKARFLDVISNRKRYTLSCGTITHIERLSREIIIYTDDGEAYKVYESLQAVSKRLPSYFSQCHSSFTVNLRYVKNLSSQETELINKIKLPVGRRYAKPFKADYLKYISEHAML